MIEGPKSNIKTINGLITKDSGCWIPQNRKPKLNAKANNQVKANKENLFTKTTNQAHNALCYCIGENSI